MAKFNKNGTIEDFQGFIESVFGLPDDRFYSIWDLLTQQQRFTMRALKGIRKGDADKTKINLLISFSWLMSIANRMHINLEDEIWKRFPYICSYCGKLPCVCKAAKTDKRVVIRTEDSIRPHSLADFQKMFAEIYPSKRRTHAEAGVHLAEEMGEVSEAIHNYLGQHQEKQFSSLKSELSDFASCVFGVANSLKIDLAKELAATYSNNCHACHQLPCKCVFSEVVAFKS
ncbi:MAG: hypothetical protein A3J09_00715 [Candidatus Zambryskibacteria bacterium RIFCSPLOWO2_02_FULL_51_21]|uniref:Uncharacterized protein n=1 Tax=Candidatus Zambryskibacteria bacterium RIFCSPHIGHO2_02_FULL_43_37 TaxID=1802749 RepID=A0A1G2THP4_9BACT|nr:MAG: hypothetical protein A2723_00710 [Candidatus Zambryskibacteria bacterium RIFCSPHIGHO2_01_FULL_52_18]OHA96723.1 MAG: hypothetical protein A3D49_02675 [Candidatus Zambryskibacteria bacterium RIFCSPHIGHO2_02_FULL_43_37]OHB07416.1 MAG: hypothetical protein A2944_01750 [Candidatus Zambryskibacteria bacterium RIFCSPLOWO2_01_FULL_52_12]OHB11078.1 MAG: hypothetical protein A3J09_00715 [Candidatus Zambryskibacteria bacterium RIFCSPLOWO2_02_FULL_51_21]